MFYWVQKIKREKVDITPPKKAVEIQIWPKTLEKKKEDDPVEEEPKRVRKCKWLKEFQENLKEED